MSEIFNTITYDENEILAVENHIEKAYGKFDSVLHEIISPDIHIDICIIKPTKERDFYTLVTMGMGAHKMNVPEEISDRARAELCIYLPSDWQIDNNEEEWYWPMRWLKILARLPIEQNTWLGYLHSIPSGAPLAQNTKLCGFILDVPNVINEDECLLPNGEIVNFYSIIPLHEEEMSYKVDNGGEILLSRIEDRKEDIFLVDINREPAVEFEDVYGGIIDAAQSHIQSIYEKEIPVDYICAYNHLAIYLRWAIENDMMCEEFHEHFSDVIDMVKNNQYENLDLRVFLHEEFNGRLLIYLFNENGAYFTADYYGENRYPQDVDSYAVKYFNGKKEEHNDEDYLFVPFDESYYNEMKKYIDKAYTEYKNNNLK